MDKIAIDMCITYYSIIRKSLPPAFGDVTKQILATNDTDFHKLRHKLAFVFPTRTKFVPVFVKICVICGYI